MSCDEEGKDHFPDLMLTLLFTHILGKDWWAGKKRDPFLCLILLMSHKGEEKKRRFRVDATDGRDDTKKKAGMAQDGLLYRLQ